MPSNYHLRRILFLAFVGGGILLGVVTPMRGSGQAVQVSSGILVKFEASYDTLEAANVLLEMKLRVLKYMPQIKVWLVTSKDASGEGEAMALLNQSPAVAWAEPNRTVRIQDVVPNDNFYQAQQDNLRVIGLPSAWTYTTGSDVLIAVIDTGVDLDHPDLQDKVWRNSGEIPSNDVDDDLNGYIDDDIGWDFVNEDNVPQDGQSHGSHVAGIAAAQTDNVIGVAGVSWGASVMALKALDNLGEGTWADVAEAILYASDNGAQILNMSFGDEEASETLDLAVLYARERDCLMVAAAGNGGSSVLYPAAHPNVIAVSATNNQDLPWSNSNRGPEVDLAAPGVDIFSTNASGSYTQLSGTSMSTPHVSGIASLVWSLASDLSSIEVTQILTTTAVDVWSPGRDQLTGWGRISASQAVQKAATEPTYLPLIHYDDAGNENQDVSFR